MTFKFSYVRFRFENPRFALEQKEKNGRTSDIDLWFIFQMHLAKKCYIYKLFHWQKDVFGEKQ